MSEQEVDFTSLTVRNDHVPTICPACGSHTIRLLGELDYGNAVTYAGRPISIACAPRLMSCAGCGSWFTAYAVRQEDAENVYRNGNGDQQWAAPAFENGKTPEVVRTIESLLRPGQVVVDVGCNTGELLDFCRQRGALTFGVELSERARSVCATKGHQMLDSLDAGPSQFDVVFAFDLIEHLYDLPVFLRTVRDALRPGGKLVLLTGDNSSMSARWSASNWWYARYPEHVLFPSWQFWRNCQDLAWAGRVRTYASAGYKASWPRRCRTMIAAGLGRGNGLPPMGPDHHLLVLSRP